MNDIVILGAGGLARELAFLIEEINLATPTWNILGFVEADGEPVDRQVGNYKVLCTESDLTSMQVAAAIGIGDPATIQKIAQRFKANSKINFPNLVHPRTIWDQERVIMGKGNIICAGVVFSTDIQIGSHNYFNMDCVVTHDDKIGDYCVVSPGVHISGNVKLGDSCMIGTSATVLPGVSLGQNVIVGAGAVVINDVPSNTTVVGMPAKPIRSRSPA